MPSLAARIGTVRLAMLFAAVVCAAAGLVLHGRGQTVRDRDRASGVIALDTTVARRAADREPAGEAVTDSEAAEAFVEDRGAVHHRTARAPDENTASGATGVAPGAPSDAQVKRELRALQGGGSVNVKGDRAVLRSNGLADAPLSAPDRVARVIAAGNEIAKFPYIWGGGHGSFTDNGYDCSGSVSYALAAGGLLDSPLTSGALASYGKPGPGRWITIYANGGHVFMVVAGLRYDTSGRSGPRGTRWNASARSTAGFTVRHPPGL